MCGMRAIHWQWCVAWGRGGRGGERKPFDQRKKMVSFQVYYTTVKNRNYWPEPNIKLQVVKPLLMQDNLPEPWYSFQRLCQISLSWGSCFIRGMLAGSSSPFVFPTNMVKNTEPSFLKIKKWQTCTVLERNKNLLQKQEDQGRFWLMRDKVPCTPTKQ